MDPDSNAMRDPILSKQIVGPSKATTDNVREVRVQWPKGAIYTDEAAKDLGPPLAQLLVDLGIKGTDSDQSTVGLNATKQALFGTPDSVAIIESGATAASKGWAGAIAALGGGTVVSAKLFSFWDAKPIIHAQILICGAIVLSACVLAVGFIMYGDVRARGQGAAAQYQARAVIAKAFLDSAPKPTVSTGDPATAHFATSDQLRTAAEGIKAHLDDSARAQIDEATKASAAFKKTVDASTLELTIGVIAMTLAQAGQTGLHVELDDGEEAVGHSVSRDKDGIWKFKFGDQRTPIAISRIAAFHSHT